MKLDAAIMMCVSILAFAEQGHYALMFCDWGCRISDVPLLQAAHGKMIPQRIQ